MISGEQWVTIESVVPKFWDEFAAESEFKAKVVKIFNEYNAVMDKAGRP